MDRPIISWCSQCNWKSADSLEPPPCFTYFGREVFRQDSSVKKSLLASINSHCEFCGCKCGGCLNINSATSCRAQGQYKIIHLWLDLEFKILASICFDCSIENSSNKFKFLIHIFKKRHWYFIWDLLKHCLVFIVHNVMHKLIFESTFFYWELSELFDI